MNCREADRWFRSHSVDSALTEDLAEHVRSCARCGPLYANRLNGGPHDSNLPPELEQQIARQLRHTLSPVSPLPARSVLIARTVSIYAVIPALVVWFIGIDGWTRMSAVQALVMGALIMASEIALSLSLVSLMVPGCRPWAPPVHMAAASWAGLVITAVVLQPAEAVSDFWRRAAICLAIGASLAVPAGFFLWRLARVGAVLDARTTGIITGYAAALVGFSVLFLHCPIMDRGHVLAGHLSVPVIGVFAGRALGARMYPLHRSQ